MAVRSTLSVVRGSSMDLAPIYRRLEWAEGHARRVRDLSAKWAADAIVTDTDHDHDRGVRIFRAEVTGEPPEEIALALGDTLHQTRAALDNLVGVLRERATGSFAFRIDTDPLTYDLDPLRGGRLDRVPTWALAAMRQIQPFPGNPARFIGDILADLHALAIIDRHRALLLAAALIDLNKTYAGTSHPGETTFALQEGGRVLTIEYPVHAQVTPATGIQIIVNEDRLRWTGEGAGWPWYPEAQDVASKSIRAARQVVDVVSRAAAQAGMSVR